MAACILVVDDDPAFLALAERVFGCLGVEVVTAPDAALALERAHAARPEAMLVDVGLPDRNGVDLGDDLARLPWRPRVVLTSTDDALAMTDSDVERRGLPFMPKEELASKRLRRLLFAGGGGAQGE